MRKYLAEFLGTFVLVFGGVGSAVLAGSHIGFVGVAFAFGLALLAMVYTIGPISGCHINPAVTLGVLLAKRIGGRDAVMYMVAQIFGAIAASALILLIASGVAGGYDLDRKGLERKAGKLRQGSNHYLFRSRSFQDLFGVYCERQKNSK